MLCEGVFFKRVLLQAFKYILPGVPEPGMCVRGCHVVTLPVGVVLHSCGVLLWLLVQLHLENITWFKNGRG